MPDDGGQSALRSALIEAMIDAGRFFHARGWVPATGGNFSARLGSEQRVVTGSGTHKGTLRPEDFLTVDAAGRALTKGKPSYETALHLQIYRRLSEVGAVLHVHGVAGTVLSRRREVVMLNGYELMKTLPGAPDPQSSVELPVFGNDQDVPRLAARVDTYMHSRPLLPAYLIAGHGLYAWGADVAQARHRVEALEFMFACELHQERTKS